MTSSTSKNRKLAFGAAGAAAFVALLVLISSVRSPEPEQAAVPDPAATPAAAPSPTPAPEPTPSPTPEPPDLTRELNGRAYDIDTGEAVANVAVLDGYGDAIARSGPDGRFTLELTAAVEGAPAVALVRPPAGWLPEGVLDGAVVFPAADPEPLCLPLALRRAPVLSGVVVMPDGATPATGAEVTAAAAEAVSLTPGGEERYNSTVARTNENGVFRLTRLPGVTNTLEARLGSARAVREIDAAAPGEDLVLTLREPVRLSGVARGPNGAPVAGALVVAVERSRPEQPVSVAALTNAAGEFRLSLARSGRVELTARAPADSGLIAPPPRTLVLADGEERDLLTIDFRAGDVIPVRVLTADGEPLEEAQVTAVLGGPRSGGPDVTAFPEPDGTARIRGLPPGGYVETLTVQAPGYATQTRRHVAVLDGEQVFRLARRGSVAVTVVWAEDGSPVQGWAYRLLRPDPDGAVEETGNFATVEAADGRAVLPEEAPGDYRIEIAALGPDGEPSPLRESADVTIEPAEDTPADMVGAPDSPVSQEITIELRGGYFVEGQVVRMPEIEPVEGAVVRFLPPVAAAEEPELRTGQPGAARPPGINIPPPAAQPAGVRPEQTATGPGGVFEFEGVAPGAYRLVAEADGLVLRWPADMFVPDLGRDAPLRLEMWPASLLNGEVRDPAGNALADALMRLSWTDSYSGEPQVAFTRTDASGFYSFPGIAPGSYDVALFGGGGDLRMSQPVAVPLNDAARADFRLDDDVRLRGLVTINGAAPGAQAFALRLAAEDGRRGPAFAPKSDGRFDVSAQPGVWRVEVLDGPASGADQPVVVSATPASQSAQIDLVSAAADVILIRPEDDTGTPVSVTVAPAGDAGSGDARRFTMTGDARHLPNLAPGRWVASAHSDASGLSASSGVVEVVAGAENTFVLDLDPQLGEWVRAGGWAPGDLGPDARVLSFDLTERLDGAGGLVLRGRPAGGLENAVISQAVLLQNGVEVAADEHTVELGEDAAPAGIWRLGEHDFREPSLWTLEVRMRSTGGGDTRGVLEVRVE